MNRYFNEKSNYDKYPVVNVPGMEEECRVGWRAISDRLEKDLSQDRKESKGRGAGMITREYRMKRWLRLCSLLSRLPVGSFRRMP